MSTILRSTLAGIAVAGSLLITAPAAQAQQDSWLWSGGTQTGGSGRELIKFRSDLSPGQVIVSFGDRRLYFITQPGQALSYPIAVPKEDARWQGITSVSQKRENPSWTPTPNMVAKNPRLPRWVPGGHPMNPLGVRALYLGSSTYRIHGTDAPWLIGQPVSSGCIRMYNQDVMDLYPRVKLGAKVVVTWNSYRGNTGPAAISEQREQRQERLDRQERPERPERQRSYRRNVDKKPVPRTEASVARSSRVVSAAVRD